MKTTQNTLHLVNVSYKRINEVGRRKEVSQDPSSGDHVVSFPKMRFTGEGDLGGGMEG